MDVLCVRFLFRALLLRRLFLLRVSELRVFRIWRFFNITGRSDLLDLDWCLQGLDLDGFYWIGFSRGFTGWSFSLDRIGFHWTGSFSSDWIGVHSQDSGYSKDQLGWFFRIMIVGLKDKVLVFRIRFGFFRIRFNGIHGIGSSVWVFRIRRFLRLRSIFGSTSWDKDVFYWPAYIY